MTFRLALFVLCVCFGQCRQPEPEPTPTELTIKFVNELKPQLIGTWQIRQAQISYKKLVSMSYPTGITKDTVLQNLAVLSLQPSTDKLYDTRILELEGTLQFRTKEYPIQARLYPTENSATVKGILYIDYNFKQGGFAITSPEADYIESIGLISENFTVETVLGEPTMTLRGLNRAIVAASLYKR